MRPWQRRGVMLAAMLATGSCGGGGDGPIAPPLGSAPPGSAPTPSPSPNSRVVTVSLVTPNADDAGVLVGVTSNQRFDSIVGVGDYEVYSDPAGFSHRVVVMGAIKSGDLFTVYVSHPTGTPSYAPSIEQIANTALELRPGLEGYTISVH